MVSGEPVVESLWSTNVPSCPTANLGVPTQATSREPGKRTTTCSPALAPLMPSSTRSEEHTSELQSQSNLVCRLLLEKKKKIVSHVTRVNRPSDTCHISH